MGSEGAQVVEQRRKGPEKTLNGGETARFYTFGVFRLDTAERLLRREGQEVPLTPKVYDTLLVLVQNVGRILDKRDLLAHLWPNTFVEEGNLNRAVSTLRKCLGDEPERPQFIETVPRRGYRFVAAVTPHHDEEPGPARPAPIRATERRHRRGWWAAGVGLLAVTLAALWYSLPAPRAAAGHVRTIAVLPFARLGLPAEDDYLGLAMADTLGARLSRLPPLVVRPTSAIRRYAAASSDPLAAGRELKVQAVVEGTVQRSGDHIRVNVQLVGIDEGFALWTGTFDGALDDVFGVQDDITRALAGALALSRSREARRAEGGPSINPEAQRAYLRGRYLWNQRTIDSFRRAIPEFERALALSPEYGAAQAGVADCHLLLGWASAAPPAETFPLAKAAAQRALQLDDTLAEAHTSLAQVLFLYDWDWTAAEAEYRRAIELDPQYATAHQWYAHFLSAMKRHPEAIRHIRLAQAADPVSRVINMNVGSILAGAERLDEAIAAYRLAIEMDPRFGNVHAALGSAYDVKGQYAEALASYQRARELYDDRPSRLSELASVHARMGHTREARALLRELQALELGQRVPPMKLAYVHGALGDRDRAFAALEQAYAEHSPDLLGLDDPLLSSLRSDPRWLDLRRRVGLPLPPS
jgi:DNA-binding winged helix-turn-helix (wHTH) protein/TolB-like protein/Tfp pilus assembly protein PilF